MIVLIHGLPDHAERVVPFEIALFQDMIRVPMAMCPPLELVNKGYLNAPTFHSILCQFTYHDGTSYHYQAQSPLDL